MPCLLTAIASGRIPLCPQLSSHGPSLYLLWLLVVLVIHPHGACPAPAGQALNSSPLVLASEAFPSLGLLILLTC